VGGYGTQILLVLVLILVNGALSGSEMALISLRESQIQRLERTSRGGRVLARLSKDPNRFLATIQIGITLAGFLASAFAAYRLHDDARLCALRATSGARVRGGAEGP
jgi:putative hemolysin